MRIHRLALPLALFLFASTSLFADPEITSVSPGTASAAGGTQILIRGTGFSDNCVICSPPFVNPNVLVGGAYAKDVRVYSSTLIGATLPPLMPGTFDVSIVQWDGSDHLPNALTITGTAGEGFERVLFPVMGPPVFGNFGSEFRTFARVWNAGSEPLDIWGEDTTCLLITPVLDPMKSPARLQPRAETENELLSACATGARVFYIPAGRGDDLVANLRVTDVSRFETTFGTEIPVVRENEMKTDFLALPGIPVGPGFRNTLRIYAFTDEELVLDVKVGGITQPVRLVPGTNPFEPAYAMFTAFPESLPAGMTTTRVEISNPDHEAEHPGFWAFVTVTNNETQHITTITPQ
jgi:hypothetical protein